MSREHPTSYQLGRHTLEISGEDQQITIANETIAVELGSEETYKLHLALQALFTQQEQPADKDADHRP
jgi:hypothetical protein